MQPLGAGARRGGSLAGRRAGFARLGKVEGRNLNPRLVPLLQKWGPFARRFWGLWGRGGEGGRPALQAGRMEVPIEPWVLTGTRALDSVTPSRPVGAVGDGAAKHVHARRRDRKRHHSNGGSVPSPGA